MVAYFNPKSICGKYGSFCCLSRFSKACNYCFFGRENATSQTVADGTLVVFEKNYVYKKGGALVRGAKWTFRIISGAAEGKFLCHNHHSQRIEPMYELSQSCTHFVLKGNKWGLGVIFHQ